LAPQFDFNYFNYFRDKTVSVGSSFRLLIIIILCKRNVPKCCERWIFYNDLTVMLWVKNARELNIE